MMAVTTSRTLHVPLNLLLVTIPILDYLDATRIDCITICYPILFGAPPCYYMRDSLYQHHNAHVDILSGHKSEHQLRLKLYLAILDIDCPAKKHAKTSPLASLSTVPCG